ncbi:MAG: cytochrome P450 [Chloroflexota bacterium]|nr:cytochrome P450 [Chloroflexota bacterium]
MVQDVNIFDNPLIAGNPFPFFAGLRKDAPVFKPPGSPLAIVSRYDDVVRILRDPVTFSSQVAVREPGERRPPTILFDDPPVHTRMRGLLTSAFTPRMVELQRESVEEYCKKLVDRMCANETADYIAGLAYPLPVMVIANMLGVGGGDMETFKRWSDAIIGNVANALFDPNTDAIDDVNREFDEYFREQLNRLRAHPEDNLLSALIHAEDPAEGKLSEEDLLVVCRVLLVAGNETTTGLIVATARIFAEFPFVLQAVKDDPSVIPSVVEEVLRYYPTFPATFRITTREVEIAGVTLPAGERILTMITSANHDETQFPNPEEFIISREPNRHVAFGMGIHYCLGAPLARMEGGIAIATLAPRIKALSFEGDPGSVMQPGGPATLPVRFELEPVAASV